MSVLARVNRKVEPKGKGAESSTGQAAGRDSQNPARMAGMMALQLLAELARRRFPTRVAMVARALHASVQELDAPEPDTQGGEQYEGMVKCLGAFEVAKASEKISKQYEQTLDVIRERQVTKRTTQGSFYTPDALVSHLVEHTVCDSTSGKMPTICDPACGTGNFLVLAGSALGESRRAWQSLYGTDIDLAAVLICRWRIWIASGCDPEVWKHACKNICVGDSLGGPPPALSGAALRQWRRASPTPPSNGHTWRKRRELLRRGKWRGFDIILGNPPFLSQLSTSTTHDASRQAWLKHRFGDLVGAYTDAAALFLTLAVEHLAPGGKLGLVLPSSVLATRDCAAVRRFVAEETRITSVWVNPARAFPGVNVLTCAVVAEKCEDQKAPHRIQTYLNQGAVRGEVLRISATAMREMPTWGLLTRGLSGLPAIHMKHRGTLADIAIATADFRDQYYGLDGHILDAAPPLNSRHVPLLTSGLIDLARTHWGRRDTRILKREWHAPAVNLDTLATQTSLGPWATQRLIPKVLLATQSRVLEPWVDEHGTSLPCVPIITITPRVSNSDHLWLIGAVLASPVISAVARVEFAGAALSATAIKLSAKQCLALALPAPSTFAAMAEGFRALSDPAATQETLDHFAQVATRGYDLPVRTAASILAWWMPLAQRSRFGPT